MTFREVETILKADGWVETAVLEQYRQYRKVGVPDAVSVPYGHGRNLSISTIKSLEKSTGLSFRR